MSAPLVVPALKKHTATVIMAHGLGDSGAGWISLAQSWRQRSKFEEVKFIFPNAPTIPITVNGGFRMPGWYDITTFSELSSGQDKVGVLRSRTYLSNLIASEVKANPSVPASRIVLGGFSQGGAVALFTGLSMPTRLGGIFGLSSYLLLSDNIKEHVEEGKGANKETPIFMGHGDSDPLVRYEWGVRTAEVIRDLGYQVDFKTYPDLEHSAALEEIDDLETYIKGALKKTEGDVPEATTGSSSNAPQSGGIL